MTSLPAQLLGILENIPENHQEKIISGWEKGRSIVSFRVNHLKSSPEEIIDELNKAALPYSVWEFSEDAFYLDKVHEYALRGLEIYTAGKIYVQGLSSMIPALCLDLKQNQKILDMAAAPGSKTTQVASMLNGKCKITALEKFGVRLEKLVHTIKAQGAESFVEVIKIDATELVAHYSKDEKGNKGEKMFDRILLDVPCSSDGRINLEDDKTYCWYSGDKSRSKSLLQYEMLEQARKMLIDGGKIVYSTCSISRRENEDVVQKFLKTHPEFTLLPSPIKADYMLEDQQGEICKNEQTKESSFLTTEVHSCEGLRKKMQMTQECDVFPCFSHMNRWYPSPMMEGFFVAILEKKN